MSKDKFIVCKCDSDIVRLLDLMREGFPLINEQREALYDAVINQFKINRLRKFVDTNCVLIVCGLLLALSSVLVLVTGYDGNLVLHYVSSGAVIILCMYTISDSMRKLQFWLMLDSKVKNKD